LNPKTASRYASLAHPIKYGEGYNSGGLFVFDPDRKAFLLEKDFAEDDAQGAKDGSPGVRKPPPPLSSQPIESVAAEYPPIPEDKTPDADTPFHQFMHSPTRIVLPGNDKKRNRVLDANPKLKAAVV